MTSNDKNGHQHKGIALLATVYKIVAKIDRNMLQDEAKMVGTIKLYLSEHNGQNIVFSYDGDTARSQRRITKKISHTTVEGSEHLKRRLQSVEQVELMGGLPLPGVSNDFYRLFLNHFNSSFPEKSASCHSGINKSKVLNLEDKKNR